jgi:hypothetical protein
MVLVKILFKEFYFKENIGYIYAKNILGRMDLENLTIKKLTV